MDLLYTSPFQRIPFLIDLGDTMLNSTWQCSLLLNRQLLITLSVYSDEKLVNSQLYH